PAEVWDLDDRASSGWLWSPGNGRVLLQREVRTPLVMIGQEADERASKGPLIPHDDMIETFATQCPNQALHKRILPRRAWRRHHFLGAKTLHEATEVSSVDAIAIPQQIRRRGLVRKGFANLLSRPGSRRMVGHIQMNDAAAVVRQDEED